MLANVTEFRTLFQVERALLRGNAGSYVAMIYVSWACLQRRDEKNPLSGFGWFQGGDISCTKIGPIVSVRSLPHRQLRGHFVGRSNGREPFIHAASRRFPLREPGRGERIRTSGLYVPNVALYLTKLHPDLTARKRCRSRRSVHRIGRQL